MSKFCCSFFSVLIFCLEVNAQVAVQVVEKYREFIPLDQEIVSGGYFVDPPKEIEGHPYFQSKNFSEGSVTINGLSYDGIPLLYNIWKDEILTFHPVHKQKTLIKSGKVEAFTINADQPSKFIRIKENEGYLHHGNGHYEVAHEGKVQVLVKHRKGLKSKREVSIFKEEFYEVEDFFISKADEMVRVQKRKQIVDFLGLDAKQVRKASREQQLNFRSNRKEYLIFICSNFVEK
jgi:hypothetical protein